MLVMSLPPIRALSIFLLVATSVLVGTPLSAQILEGREDHGRMIECLRSGLGKGLGWECATEGHTFVFVGSILSVTKISETEKRLQLAPEEVFRGKPDSRLTVTTGQGACFPEIRAGDKWLFYLMRDDKDNTLRLDYYNSSGSKPVADAQEDIDRLRRLAQMVDSGMVLGSVYRSFWDDVKKRTDIRAMPNHRLLATRVSGGTRYTTTTDGNGRYEFELPPGVYDLTANTVPGLWARSGGAGVSPGSCSGLAFEIRSDGMIAGRVKAANGKPLKDAAVTLVPVSGAVGFSAWSKAGDEHGYFEFRGVNPGRYLVGIGIAAQPGSPEWESRVYYPGVRSKEEAVAVGLGEAEKRSDINFQLPNLAAP